GPPATRSPSSRRAGAGWKSPVSARAAICRRITVEQPMWVLMYVFSSSIIPAATNDRAEWRLLPTVVFQEFSNEERCRAAKGALESSLKEAGTRLRSGLEDLKAIG